jgi:heme-degrading monooxygenase HmoA
MDSGPTPCGVSRNDEIVVQHQEKSSMYIAMNRFRVTKGSESAFEQVWLSRDTHLDKVPGFVEFHLLRGPELEDHTLYASHTVWANHAAFEAWTKSEAFRAAHQRAGDNKPLYLGHPQFEGFEVIQTAGRGAKSRRAENVSPW